MQNTKENYGPAHVNRLDSIKKLKREGFEGTDASLAESLFEYGMVWRKLTEAERMELDKTATPNQAEWLFIYRTGGKRFDRTSIAECDPFKEWNWVKWESFFAYLGTTKEEWLEMPFPFQVENLVSYHGYEEIFGSSYWEGFAIAGNPELA